MSLVWTNPDILTSKISAAVTLSTMNSTEHSALVDRGQTGFWRILSLWNILSWIRVCVRERIV
jgi:hypothetical protein